MVARQLGLGSEKTLTARFNIPFVVQRDAYIVSRFVSYFSTAIVKAHRLALVSEKAVINRFGTFFGSSCPVMTSFKIPLSAPKHTIQTVVFKVPFRAKKHAYYSEPQLFVAQK